MHNDNFFKDRHYLHTVFPSLIESTDPTSSSSEISSQSPIHLLEVGCGCGNAVWPLLELNPRLHVTAIDFAKSAIEIVKKHPKYISENTKVGMSSDATTDTTDTTAARIKAFVCNLVVDPLPVGLGMQQFVLCMFVLSAIDPDRLAPPLCFYSLYINTYYITMQNNRI